MARPSPRFGFAQFQPLGAPKHKFMHPKLIGFVPACMCNAGTQLRGGLSHQPLRLKRNQRFIKAETRAFDQRINLVA